MYSRLLRFGREGVALDRLVTPSPNRVQIKGAYQRKLKVGTPRQAIRVVMKMKPAFIRTFLLKTEPITACTIFRNSLVCVRPFCQLNCLYDLDWDGTAVQTNVAPQVTEY